MDTLGSILLPYGYPGLFLASFLASTVLPLGSEGVVILLITRNFNIFSVVLVATVGNYLGACTSYYLGLAGRTKLIGKYLHINASQMEHAQVWFEKYGSWSLLFTWVPVLGDALPVAAGMMKLKFGLFSILVFAGKLIRYGALAYLVYVSIDIL
jgi:membrane protein YqaA with SNARE-associated domain